MSATSEPPALAFVVPALDGPPTGGTRYNRCLVRALATSGRPPLCLGREQARTRVAEPVPRAVWVDSLWLSAIPELVRRSSPACRVGLLAHWLPTLVSHGEAPPRHALMAEERGALDHAHAVLAPSRFLRDQLVRLGVEPERVLVLEPGTELPVAPYPQPEPRDAVHAVVVANLLPGKGIAPLLEALASALRPSDALELRVIGSRRMDPEYAQQCAARVERIPSLRRRVRLTGSQPHPRCVEAILRADLLVSASRMESYGMALADARACGRPILARPGGHVAAHVDPRWGGQLVRDEPALAAALVELAREPAELRARQRLAWAHRTQRPWSAVASQLLRRVSIDWPPPRPPQ